MNEKELREKTIKEMAKILSAEGFDYDGATALYKAGYRKTKAVRKEIGEWLAINYIGLTESEVNTLRKGDMPS